MNVDSDSIYKMETVPFIIEVWNVDDEKEERLIGTLVLNMKPAYYYLTTPDLYLNNQQPFLLYD